MMARPPTRMPRLLLTRRGLLGRRGLIWRLAGGPHPNRGYLAPNGLVKGTWIAARINPAVYTRLQGHAKGVDADALVRRTSGPRVAASRLRLASPLGGRLDLQAFGVDA